MPKPLPLTKTPNPARTRPVTLTPEETVELERRLEEYPDWYKEQGRVEEIENLLAERELKLLPPLTLEDADRIIEALSKLP